MGRPALEPSHAAPLARPRPRRPRLVRLLARSLAIALVVGLAAAGYLLRRDATALASALDGALVSLGLGIDQVSVAGYEHADIDEIFTALDLATAGSIVTFDSRAARERIEALAWVGEARIARVLPNGLAVTITERRPAAVWQYRQMPFLVDADGRVLGPVDPDTRRDLPYVVGEGANTAIGPLLVELSGHPEIAARTRTMVREGDRRWTLHLEKAPDLLLPAEGIDAALALLERLQAEERILDRAILAIDLRIAGRVTLRLPAGLAERLRARRRSSAALTVSPRGDLRRPAGDGA
ncbi:MAG: FtsQ-type POTRA domain-containing protein [Hyphomicrobiaceae bacterium]